MTSATTRCADYSLWPRSDLILSKPLDALIKVVYQKLVALQVIRVRGEEWTSIKQVVLLPAAWDDLEDPLSADGLPLPEPRLNAEVVAGFQKAGIAVQTVTPQSVRDRLCQVQPLLHPGILLAQAPLQCLRQRPWLETLLRFCLSDRPKDLTGLPLAMMTTGLLRSFGSDPNYAIFTAGDEERAIFAKERHWFIDGNYAEACGLTNSSVPTGLHWMTTTLVTRLLSVVLPGCEEDSLG